MKKKIFFLKRSFSNKLKKIKIHVHSLKRFFRKIDSYADFINRYGGAIGKVIGGIVLIISFFQLGLPKYFKKLNPTITIYSINNTPQKIGFNYIEEKFNCSVLIKGLHNQQLFLYPVISFGSIQTVEWQAFDEKVVKTNGEISFEINLSSFTDSLFNEVNLIFLLSDDRINNWRNIKDIDSIEVVDRTSIAKLAIPYFELLKINDLSVQDFKKKNFVTDSLEISLEGVSKHLDETKFEIKINEIPIKSRTLKVSREKWTTNFPLLIECSNNPMKYRLTIEHDFFSNKLFDLTILTKKPKVKIISINNQNINKKNTILISPNNRVRVAGEATNVSIGEKIVVYLHLMESGIAVERKPEYAIVDESKEWAINSRVAESDSILIFAFVDCGHVGENSEKRFAEPIKAIFKK